jgi:flagellar protein FliO/FliZ
MNHSPDLIEATLKMIFALAIVLGLLWLIHRWIRRTQPGAAAADRGRLIRVLGSHYLGTKKSIALVKVPGAVLVLGIGTEQVNLLTRLDDPDAIAALETNTRSDRGVGFREQLQRMIRPFTQRPEHGAGRNPSNEVS